MFLDNRYIDNHGALRHPSAVIVSKFKFSTYARMIAARALRAAILSSHIFEGPDPATTFYAKFKIAGQQLL
jgi:hypothetical protein